MKIQGKVIYKKLSGGFWCITDMDGNNWRPVSMPKALQEKGLKVQIEAKEAPSQAISIFMWGTSIEILKFGIVS